MKYSINLLFIMLFAGSLITCGGKNDNQKAGDYTPLAEQFVDMLVNEEYDNAVQKFDSTMKHVLPADKLEDVWQNLLTQVGHYKRQLGIRQTNEQGYDIVYISCEFEEANADVKIVFNKNKEIAGLWFVPPLEYKQ
jgi:oligoribonuclease NrnB/cAMP/cGMP phosphodiesterase (DHH superfamily)